METVVYAISVLSILVWTTTAQDMNSCINNGRTPSSCTTITTTACNKFYDQSTFPNNVTEDISSAVTSLSQYLLVSTPLSCSRYAEIYFCLSLMPACGIDDMAPSDYLGPCESFCELIRSSCSSHSIEVVDMQFDCLISSCSRFPSQGCIDVHHPIVQQAVALLPTQPPTDPATPSAPATSRTNTTVTLASNAPASCPQPNNTFFSDSSKSFAVGWISFWSALCFVSTSLTILTFLLETSRFQYPWRPVVYLAVVFNVHSVAYFFSLALGRKIITCPGGELARSGSPWSWAHTPCILVFMVLYYTVLAAFIWWVILSTCWFLVAALKWSHESVGKMSPLFHVTAWVLPLLFTIGLMAARAVGADELTGTCFVVSDSSTSTSLALLFGVILPLMVLLVIGLVFLLIGFISILRIRTLMQKGGKQQEQQSLEKLLIRIGVFVTVFIIPASILIGCYVYELASRSSWVSIGISCSSCSRPNSAVFMVRVFMFLLIGVLTGVWIWSPKTLKSWQQCPSKCMACCNPPLPEEADAEMPEYDQISAKNVLSQKMPTYSLPDSGLEST